MAVSNNALITLDELKSAIEMVGSTDAVDSELEFLIDRITDAFENYCTVNTFKQATITEYYDGKGDQYLFVKNIPINSITSIWDDADWEWGTDDIIDSDDYRIVDKRYIVHKSYWNEGIQNIKITYNYGYTTIPGDLKQVCIDETYRKWKRRKEPDVLRKDIREGGTADYVSPGWLKSTIQVLDKYKHMRAF